MALAQKIKGLYRRGKQWWLRYTPAPGMPQVRESLKTEIEGQAAALALSILNKAPLERAGEWQAEVEAYFADGLRNHTLSEATVHGRRYALGAFARDCEVSRLSHLTTANVERWVGLLRGNGRAPGTVETCVMHLRAFCTWLVRNNKLRENPARAVRLGKQVVKGRKNFVTKDKIRELIANAPNDELRFVLFCGFHAGMRKLEITEARPEWFQLSGGKRRGSIQIGETPTYRPKDREERTVPLTSEFETFLRSYLASLPEGAAWALRGTQEKRKAKVRYRVQFTKQFDAYVKSQGVRCTLHDMRRSFVSNKIIDDSSLIFKLAKWTGTDVRTLQKHYGHLLSDDDDIEAGV